MDAHRFDAMTRRFAAGTRRRALAALAAGAVASAFLRLDALEVAAGCKGYKGKCKKKSQCCKKDGLRCKRGRCRCKKGWKHCPETGDDCTPVKSDSDNCGSCGHACPPATPCCINGSCQEMCGGSCCADCFVDKLEGIPQPLTESCCGPGAGTFCRANKHDPSDDKCCYPDQVCIDGQCCCNGCQGAVICGGACCASASCCNGACCPDGEVCGMTTDGLACVPADRACAVPANCLEGEECLDGACCSGDRVCSNPLDGDFCCPAGEYCDTANPASAGCCAINTTCESTWRSHRVRR